MSQYFNNSIFWIETDKIKPNPYQPRREFDPIALKDLAESIRMYGLLQPLTVTRKEVIKEDGGLGVEYELIAGERRLRASKIAGLQAIPAIIRAGEEDARVKLELAIIENLQREDLNPVDRARAFQKLADEFSFKHSQIAEKMGKSREYVTNSIRLLSLPEHMLQALSEKKISEGHTRPLLMLVDRPEEQETLFKEIMYKKITVREAEALARKVAIDRVRKKDFRPDPELIELETKLNEALGTRVQIERRENGGKIMIDFFTHDDLRQILQLLETNQLRGSHAMLHKHIESQNQKQTVSPEISPIQGSAHEDAETLAAISAATPLTVVEPETMNKSPENSTIPAEVAAIEQSQSVEEIPVDGLEIDTTKDSEDEDLYSIKNFSI